MDSDTTHNEEPVILLDAESSSHFGQGASLEPEPESVFNENNSLNLDTDTHQFVALMENTLRCINCGVEFGKRRKHLLALVLLDVQSVICQWIAPQRITEDSMVCHSCWTLALHSSCNENATNSSGGRRRQLCINCDTSIMRKRSHILNSNTERDTRIRNVIMEWIAPRPVPVLGRVCHPCWMRANRVKVKDTEAYCSCADCDPPLQEIVPTWQRVTKDPKLCEVHGKPSHPSHRNKKKPDEDTDVGEDDPTKQDISFIKLSDYIRAAEVSNKCFVEACDVTEVETPPIFMRKSLLKQCNFYIPKTCLVCTRHKTDWDFMAQPMEEIHVFKPEHVAGMLQVMSAKC